MRYVCKNCGKFISANSKQCKSCGAKDSAILLEERKSKLKDSDDRKIMECPYCGHHKELNEDINERYVTCWNCRNVYENPYYQPQKLSVVRIIIAIIVITVICTNIYIAVKRSEENPSNIEKNQYTQSTATPKNIHTFDNSENNQPITSYKKSSGYSASQKDTKTEKKFDKNNFTALFKESGGYDIYYFWKIIAKNGKLRYEYIISDGKQSKVRKSGYAEGIKTSTLKSKYPGLTFTGGRIKNDAPLFILYNFDDDDRHQVNAIIQHDIQAQKSYVYLNDSDNPYEYIYMNSLILMN